MKILLTLNATPKSESIIPYVVELARGWKAEVLVTRVLDPVVGVGDPLVPLMAESFYLEMVRAGEDYLKEIGKRFQGVAFRTFCLVGSPGECIRQLAVEEQCDLLVMASHGHTGFVRWLWGSVAEGLARIAPCPVLLVRRDTPALIRQILVPIDGSDSSSNVVEHLAPFVDPRYTRVTVLHCSGASEAGLDQTRSKLKNLVDGKGWIQLEFSSSRAPDGIYKWLADHPCDMVAMSTHGREGLAHLWTGSMMEQVARNANCPVLVFPPALVQEQSAAESILDYIDESGAHPAKPPLDDPFDLSRE